MISWRVDTSAQIKLWEASASVALGPGSDHACSDAAPLLMRSQMRVLQLATGSLGHSFSPGGGQLALADRSLVTAASIRSLAFSVTVPTASLKSSTQAMRSLSSRSNSTAYSSASGTGRALRAGLVLAPCPGAASNAKPSASVFCATTRSRGSCLVVASVSGRHAAPWAAKSPRRVADGASGRASHTTHVSGAVPSTLPVGLIVLKSSAAMGTCMRSGRHAAPRPSPELRPSGCARPPPCGGIGS
mmetsp:Transcript_17166/g.46799  ORF Transcript_17166/g.46799 Transcript_17166/m.46799 type:complete len:245 (-) Transcript_17166:24-758(-)